MSAEFKIARLRYNWAGAWGTGLTFNRDDVVSYNGKTYICLIPHIAGDFYVDIAHVTGTGAITPYWELSIDGKEWKQLWTTNTYYSLGNIVRYGGVVYVCTGTHTSATGVNPQIDLAFWTPLSTFSNWKNSWTPNTVFGVGDVVKYGGIVYSCNTNHISATDTATGLEADQGKWTLVNNGVEYKGVWVGSTRYKLNDIAKYGPDLFICTTGHTSGSYDSTLVFDTTKWATWMPGIEFASTYSDLAIYKPGDVVIYGGYSYVSVTNNNRGNIPTQSSSDWSVLTQGYLMQNEWSMTTTYKLGDIVRRHGMLFEAAQDVPASSMSLDTDPTSYSIATTLSASSSTTTLVLPSTVGLQPGMIVAGTGFTLGQQIVKVVNSTDVLIDQAPDGVTSLGQAVSFNGINYIYWTLLNPGIQYLGRWLYLTEYVVGDVVYWANGTYRCVLNHVSTGKNALVPNRPDSAISNTYWVKLVLHAKNNSLNTPGDIETFSATANTHVPVAIGAETQVLKSNDNLPAWSTINEIANVFYVSEKHGTDGAAYGASWDKPIKSIKYACDRILAGTMYTNARAMAELNRDWVIQEMYQWMLKQKSTSGAPFSPSSAFDEGKTKRDAGLIFEAVLYDLTRGGNSQVVASTIAYFVDGSETAFVNAGTEATMPYIIAAITKMNSLITQYAITSTPMLDVDSAQAYNNIPVGLRVVQVIDSVTYPLESGAAAAINILFSIVTTALANHTIAGLPARNQGITSTIFLKTGTYRETLPIVVPENTAIVGEELRGSVVTPANIIDTIVKSTSTGDSSFTVTSTLGIEHNTPIQFSGAISIGAGTLSIGGITTGQTFYVNDTNASNVGMPEVDAIEYLNGDLLHPDGHSKIVGFALDGYPIYGPYGYTNPNSAVTAPKRMQSGYTLNSSSTRVNPVMNTSQYPMGLFNEDWSFTNPAGTDLDEYNGRYCVTPDYPNGTYAYFTTITAGGAPAYPYSVGKRFYGVPNPLISDYYSGGGTAPANYFIEYTSQKSNFDGMQSSWTISADGGTIRVKAKGVPYHSFGSQTSTNNPIIQNYDLSFKFRGGTNQAASTKTPVGTGQVGFWLNGVAIFGATASQGAPSGFNIIPGYTYNVSFGSGQALGYSYGQDLSGGVATADGVYRYIDSSFISAWNTGTGSNITGTAITATKFSISAFPGGPIFPIQTASAGNAAIYVYGGDAIQDMFRLRNGTGLRNMTFTGLLGSLGGINEFQTQRPSGGSYSSLDPGRGPNDSRSWIYRRSPYTQNCTVFGYGCTGIKIDGDLHRGGNKSIVANDYTTILSGGIGVWCTGSGALTELVSVFAYYSYSGYLAEAGGRIRATNGNTSYGTFGVIAEGYDLSEVPIAGTVYNKSSQVQASVQSSLSGSAQLTGVNYGNAGVAYYTSTTNNLLYSNNYFNAAWTNDGNVVLQKNALAPNGISEAWTFTALTGGTDTAYLTQAISIPAAGKTYSGLPANNLTGSGVSATFDVTVTSTSYTVQVNSGGSGYVTGNTMFIPGSQLGGTDTVNDCTITVQSLSGSAILTVGVAGTVPTNSAKNYTLSAYVKQGNANTVDLAGIFSGNTTVQSKVSFNFVTGVTTASSDGVGFIPTLYGAKVLPDGWYRLYMSINDVTGLNTTLTHRIYARGVGQAAGYTYIYGNQLEVSKTNGQPSFYQETQAAKYTAYANYNVIGSGTGAQLVGDENRSGGVFQTRLTDLDGSGSTGGNGYLTASNNSQGGTDQYILLAGSDTRTATNYVGMNLFINSGTGAGQYGYISYFDSGVSKRANILKPSFDALKIGGTNATGNTFTLTTPSKVDKLYIDMPVEFIPTYYKTSVSASSVGYLISTAVTGGIYNTVSVASTAQLRTNQAVKFFADGSTQAVFGGLTGDYNYYIAAIIDSTTIQVASTIYGAVQQLVTQTGSMTMAFPSGTSYLQGATDTMTPNLLIQFTGTALGGTVLGGTYYIQDIIDSTHFTVSTGLVSITPTATSATGNTITVASTATLVPLNPIIFSGTTTGTGLAEGNKYYISRVINGTTFSVSSSILTRIATATQLTSNLITVDSTAGFLANNPITFIGNGFGNVQTEYIYYILAVNNATSFTISGAPGGSSVSLYNATGTLTVRTAPLAQTLTTNASVTNLTGTSTAAKQILTAAVGKMNAQYQTSVYGGVSAGTVYYVNSIDSGNNTFTVANNTVANSGVTVTLQNKVGSMNLGATGFDHVIPGTPIITVLDNSAVYFIEPRLTFTDPSFTQTSSNTTVLSAPNYWVSVAYGDNTWIAIPSSGQIGTKSTTGNSWTSTTLPAAGQWADIAYGDGAWVAISSGGVGNSPSATSFSNGAGWRAYSLPTADTWAKVKYGKGKFVAISASNGTAAYSTNAGQTWQTGSGLPTAIWTGLAYGKGVFVAVATSSATAASSTDGVTWTTRTLPSNTNWSSVAYGNNKFVAVSSSSSKTAYSVDGITWYQSYLPITAGLVEYGQGVFLAITASSAVAYTSEDGLQWTTRTVSPDSYGGMAYGLASTSYTGYFVTAGSVSAASRISAGCRTKVRPIINSNIITSINSFEPGSGYVTAPTVTFTDPNTTLEATVQPRIGNGVLGNPTFVSKGSGYTSTNTTITISGNGYSDAYQTGLTLIVNNLSKLPRPGDNLSIAGIDKIYKVTNATVQFGTTAPNIEANLQVSPELTVAVSPENGTAILIRQQYSQARLTGHDFLDIGTGDVFTTNYPQVDTLTDQPENQAIESNYGRVFYQSTDQDGNFKIGTLFGVEQATGIVTLSASQFGLSGLETLSLGGIAVGGSSVVVQQFSKDQTFVANSNNIVPTQKAIKAYLTGRLSQGGSNTFTGQLIAGTVLVGGPDKIGSTIPEGTLGSNVKVLNVAIFGKNGGYGQFCGDGEAMFRFLAAGASRGNA